MTNRAPSDKADKILIRLPDGMRDKLHTRAAANGRSMTAEVVAMLESALNDKRATDPDALAKEASRILSHLDSAKMQAKNYEERLDAINEELRAIYGDKPDGVDPITYAVRRMYRLNDEKFEASRLAARMRHDKVDEKEIAAILASGPSPRVEKIMRTLAEKYPKLDRADLRYYAETMAKADPE